MINGIRVIGIGILDHLFAGEEDRESLDDFFALAQETGGEVIKDIGRYRDDEAGLLKQLFGELRNFYVLRITPPVPLQKPERLNLSLLAGDGKKTKGIDLSYPQHFLPCTP